MILNRSKVAPNTSSVENLMKWRCFRDEEEVFSSANGFLLNLYLLTFFNAAGTIFGLLSNSFIIFGANRNKRLNKVTKTLTILLAVEGLLVATVIQPLYTTSRAFPLAGIFSSGNQTYCALDTIMAYGSMVLLGFTIVTMLGITGERYVTVMYPHHYRSKRSIFLKVLIFCLPVPPTHFLACDFWPWYNNVARILTVSFTFIPYVSTVIAYSRIYCKLRKFNEVTHAVRSAESKKRDRSLIFTSMLAVGTHLVCFLPLGISRALNFDKEYLLVQLYLRPWFATLFFCSFFVNSLLYGWHSAKLSVQILRRCCKDL